MFENISISEELKTTSKKRAEKDLREAENALQAITKELSDKDGETFKMREYFGWGKKIDEVNRKITTAKVLLEGGLFSYGAIGSVCRKYNLRCLPSTYYVRPIPAHALDDVRKFKATFNEEPIVSAGEEKPHLIFPRLRIGLDGTFRWERRVSDEYFNPEALCVIAPASHFSRAYEPVAADPVILYQNPDGSFQYVTHFGNDFTWTRRLQGIAKSFAVNFLPGFRENWNSAADLV